MDLVKGSPFEYLWSYFGSREFWSSTYGIHRRRAISSHREGGGDSFRGEIRKGLMVTSCRSFTITPSVSATFMLAAQGREKPFWLVSKLGPSWVADQTLKKAKNRQTLSNRFLFSRWYLRVPNSFLSLMLGYCQLWPEKKSSDSHDVKFCSCAVSWKQSA